MSREILEAVRQIEKEKGIEDETLVRALEDALLAAVQEDAGRGAARQVELDRVSGDFRVWSIELPPDVEERLLDEARERAITELEAAEAENGERSHTLISDDDLAIDWSDVAPELVKRADVTPENFGRIAAQTAKQVILQRIREAEREMMYDEYVDRVSEVVTGIVQQAGDRNNVLVDLGKVEALLPRSEQVDGERYEQGSRIKAVITEVRSGTKGPQVILSRRDPELIKTLFELEVPEIADGLVEIRGVAREPGYRSKIAVESHVQGVDPVGACVGPRGSRVRMVVSELRGEKIDIIPWNPEPARFVAKALSPARARGARRRRDDGGDGRRPRRPALARDRQGGPERPPGRAPDRLEDRHRLGDRVRAEPRPRPPSAAGRRGVHRPLRGDPLHRQALPEHVRPGSRYCGIPAHRELAAREEAGEELDPSEAVPVGRLRGRRPRPRRPRRRGRGEPRARRGRPPSRGGRAACVVSEPTRTCVGCGRKAPQRELVRFAAPTGRARGGTGGACRAAGPTPAAPVLLRAGGVAPGLLAHAAAHRHHPIRV